MAQFNFNVEDALSFSAEQYSLIETDCASQYVYKVTANEGNSIRFSLEGSDSYPVMWTIQSYEINGVEHTDWEDIDEVTIAFSTDLYIKFVLENSGEPGRFNKCKVNISDDTSGNSYQDSVLRTNDSTDCMAEDPNPTFDELTDTPDNKSGKSLQLVRVNVAEDALEYVDAGALGSDLNYTHVFSSTTSVVINHDLGKMPSVTVVDGSGNIVHGDINYTDVNNLTITFKTAFSGTVYLN